MPFETGTRSKQVNSLDKETHKYIDLPRNVIYHKPRDPHLEDGIPQMRHEP
jgi:hypothetical protein